MITYLIHGMAFIGVATCIILILGVALGATVSFYEVWRVEASGYRDFIEKYRDLRFKRVIDRNLYIATADKLEGVRNHEHGLKKAVRRVQRTSRKRNRLVQDMAAFIRNQCNCQGSPHGCDFCHLLKELKL